MTKNTTKYLIIASVYCIICAGFFGYSLYTLRNQGVKLQSLQAEHKIALEKEEQFTTITKIIESTTKDRAELVSYFITERDTIGYISIIEDMAKRVCVTLQTNSLAIVPKSDPLKTKAHLNASFAVTGPKSAVDTFMKKIELTPFHQVVTDMTITVDATEKDANGIISVQVTLAS